MADHTHKILLCRLDRLGDVLQTAPAMALLVKHYRAEYVGLFNPLYIPLLSHDLKINQYIAWQQHNTEQIAKTIASQQCTHLINFSHETCSKLLLPKLGFIKKRYGAINGLSSLFCYNHRVWQGRSQARFSEAEYCHQLLVHFGFVPQAEFLQPFRITFTKQEIHNACAFLARYALIKKQFIVLHMGMRGSALNWPLAHYYDLVQTLLKNGHSVVLTGSGAQEAQANADLVQSLAAPNLLDVSNAFSLKELAAFLQFASLVVAPSTGVLHLANAVGTKILGIYSPIQVQNKTRWSPFGFKGWVCDPFDESFGLAKEPKNARCPAKHRCLQTSCPHYNCMEKIAPQHLADKIHATLAAKTAS